MPAPQAQRTGTGSAQYVLIGKDHIGRRGGDRDGNFDTLERAVAGMKKGTSAEVPFFMFFGAPETIRTFAPAFGGLLTI